ncbi:MAG: M24 family metallopeptidase [Chloroflexi bacterium]|nr:M24 family metallopeptidase [Chloroflexota bacterium]MCY3937201.1 M24 family metallopeptidase [Chloroflexota bacterium]
MSNRESEFDEKIARVRRLMARKGWQWVALSGVDSLAWITGGARCFVDPGGPAGIATLLLGADTAILVTDTVEERRLRDEELGGLPLEYSVQDWTDWYSRRAEVLKGLIGADHGVSDIPLSGWESGESELQKLRFSLTGPEQSRFRKLAREAAVALEKVAREIRRGITESQIAANIEAELAAAHIRSPVTLVAADERVFNYRHPLATAKNVDRYVMVVSSATRHGLYASLTRLVHFGSPTKELRDKARACAEIDAAMISATRVGAPVSSIFSSAVQAYADQGYAGEWKLHHQGGAAGYRSREYFADFTCPFMVDNAQAFAWNPSITGVKSEDTVLVNELGADAITATGNWPQIATGKGLDRPAILEL